MERMEEKIEVLHWVIITIIIIITNIENKNDLDENVLLLFIADLWFPRWTVQPMIDSFHVLQSHTKMHRMRMYNTSHVEWFLTWYRLHDPFSFCAYNTIIYKKHQTWLLSKLFERYHKKSFQTVLIILELQSTLLCWNIDAINNCIGIQNHWLYLLLFVLNFCW